MTTFGQAIRQARESQKIAQKDLARDLCISAQYLGDIELDRRAPPDDAAIRDLARYLHYHPDELYFLAGRVPPDIMRHGLKSETICQAMRIFREALGVPTRYYD